MKKKILTTILVSTYNRPDILEIILLCLNRQTILPAEVVVADDGSDKETKLLIDSYRTKLSFPIIHVWQKNEGFRAGQIRNKGLAKASGDYIIQIDGDMLPERHFIEDHLTHANENYFTVASRVNTTQELVDYVLRNKKLPPSIFNKGVVNKLNALRIPFLTNFYKLRYKKNDIYYARGCNMAFWREDIIAVNGYNEDMIGWGREDSELAVRLLNLGKKKQFLKFGAVAYHMYHPFNSRERESINIKIWEETIENKLVKTSNGLDKYLS